jgi:hypothetical protein
MTTKAADLHPLIQRGHVMRMTTVYPEGMKLLVASCQCGWRMGVTPDEKATLDDAIEHHLQAAIAAGVVARTAGGAP